MHSVSYFSTWIYFVIAFMFLELISQGNNKAKMRRCGQTAFLIIYLFAILRYNIGNDYHSYWLMVTEHDMIDKLELLSGGIIDFVYYLGFPPTVFIIFSSICLFSYKYVISRYSSNQALSWFFYFTFPLLFFQDCSTLRQSGAMGCFFMAFAMMDKKDYVKTLLFVILAVLFHNSGYVCLLVFFLPLFKKVDLKVNIVALVASLFAGKLVERLVVSYLAGWGVADRFLYYIDQEMTGFNSFQYVLYGLNILNLLFYKSLCKLDPRNALYITLVNVGLCLFNVFQIEAQTAMRMAAFFLLFELFIVPYYIGLLVKTGMTKRFATVALWGIMFALQLMMVVIYISAYNKGALDTAVYTPYRLWLFNL